MASFCMRDCSTPRFEWTTKGSLRIAVIMKELKAPSTCTSFQIRVMTVPEAHWHRNKFAMSAFVDFYCHKISFLFLCDWNSCKSDDQQMIDCHDPNPKTDAIINTESCGILAMA